jgi:hypothetical protein
MNAYILISLIWLVSVAVSFCLGYLLRTIVDRLKKLEKALMAHLEKRTIKPVEEPKSSFIDMEDPAQRIKWEHEENLRRLNPEKRL